MISDAKKYSHHFLWDVCCVASVVGIWPRFIEPRLVTTNMVTLKVKELPEELSGLKILHFSDLHWQRSVSNRFLAKLCRKAAAFNPDIVVFTGDFLTHSRLEDAERLCRFLSTFPRGRYGSFAVLGNHDYAKIVSVNDKGVYTTEDSRVFSWTRGIKRLFRKIRPTAMQLAVRDVPMHSELLEILSQTPFQLLHNASQKITIGSSALNICGLGEYTLGRCDPVTAFQKWDKECPGIVLTHNPDCVPLLEGYPGAVILAGHTHGGQVNLPGLSNLFTTIEHPNLWKGMIYVQDKWLYITRGVGGVIPFRCFAPPELLCLTLKSA